MSGGKRTRDLPILNVCHGCQYRASNSGKDKLATLPSEWRVVLLCRKCYSRVESAEMCSYCFLETSPECFRCSECARKIHKGCALGGNNVQNPPRPLSGIGFSSCIDCWLPKSLRPGCNRIVEDRSKIVRSYSSGIIAEGSNKVLNVERRVRKAPGSGAGGRVTVSQKEKASGLVARSMEDSIKCCRSSAFISGDPPEMERTCRWNLEACRQKNEFGAWKPSDRSTSSSSNIIADETKPNAIDVEEEEGQSCSVRFTVSSMGENGNEVNKSGM